MYLRLWKILDRFWYTVQAHRISKTKFEFEFSFFLASEESEDKIVAVTKAVSEIEKVDAEEIHLDEYVKRGRSTGRTAGKRSDSGTEGSTCRSSKGG